MAKIEYDASAVGLIIDKLELACKQLDYTYQDFNSLVNTLKSLNGIENLSIDYNWLLDLPSKCQEYISEESNLIKEKSEQIEQYNQEVGEANVFKRLFYTSRMADLKLKEGILTAGEQIIDGVASAVGYIAGLSIFGSGGDNVQDSIGNFVKKDWVGDHYRNQYDNGYLSNTEKFSYFSSKGTAAKVFKGVGIAAGYIAAIAATGGIGGAIGGTGAAAGATGAVSSLGVSAAFAGVGGLGVGTQEGLQKGKKYKGAFKEGMKTAAIQAASVVAFHFVAKGAGTVISKLKNGKLVNASTKGTVDFESGKVGSANKVDVTDFEVIGERTFSKSGKTLIKVKYEDPRTGNIVTDWIDKADLSSSDVVNGMGGNLKFKSQDVLAKKPGSAAVNSKPTNTLAGDSTNTEITDINSLCKELKRLNPNSDIEVVGSEIGQPRIRVKNGSVEDLKLPEGYEYNAKNGINNKGSSSLYSSYHVENGSVAKAAANSKPTNTLAGDSTSVVSNSAEASTRLSPNEIDSAMGDDVFKKIEFSKKHGGGAGNSGFSNNGVEVKEQQFMDGTKISKTSVDGKTTFLEVEYKDGSKSSWIKSETDGFKKVDSSLVDKTRKALTSTDKADRVDVLRTVENSADDISSVPSKGTVSGVSKAEVASSKAVENSSDDVVNTISKTDKQLPAVAEEGKKLPAVVEEGKKLPAVVEEGKKLPAVVEEGNTGLINPTPVPKPAVDTGVVKAHPHVVFVPGQSDENQKTVVPTVDISQPNNEIVSVAAPTGGGGTQTGGGNNYSGGGSASSGGSSSVQTDGGKNYSGGGSISSGNSNTLPKDDEILANPSSAIDIPQNNPEISTSPDSTLPDVTDNYIPVTSVDDTPVNPTLQNSSSSVNNSTPIYTSTSYDGDISIPNTGYEGQNLVIPAVLGAATVGAFGVASKNIKDFKKEKSREDKDNEEE